MTPTAEQLATVDHVGRGTWVDPEPDTLVDRHLVEAAIRLHNHAACADLGPDLRDEVTNSAGPTSSLIAAALYATYHRPGCADHLADRLNNIGDAEYDVRERTRRDHEWPCAGQECDTCAGINRDLFADAVRELRYLLGERLCADLRDGVTA